MNKTTTIRRNANKKIAAIFAAAKSATVQSLSNCFTAEDCPVEYVRDRFLEEKDGYHGPRMTDNGNGTYKVRYHSNLWYTIDTREIASEAPVVHCVNPNPAHCLCDGSAGSVCYPDKAASAPVEDAHSLFLAAIGC